MLLADYGYKPYANAIETTTELVENNPDLVKRFFEASIKGWYIYLAESEAGNNLIKNINPKMNDELIAYTIAKLKEQEILVSGEAKKLGIGSMKDAIWEVFFSDMVEYGFFKENTNYKQAYTL